MDSEIELNDDEAYEISDEDNASDTSVQIRCKKKRKNELVKTAQQKSTSELGEQSSMWYTYHLVHLFVCWATSQISMCNSHLHFRAKVSFAADSNECR